MNRTRSKTKTSKYKYIRNQPGNPGISYILETKTIQATTQLKTLEPRPSDQDTDAVNPGIKK